MGADFIRQQSGQPWRKRWDKGVNRLKQPSLFDVQFSFQLRIITADIDPGVNVQTGDELVVHCGSDTATICRGQNRVGAIKGLTSDVRASITDSGGVALGIVERVSLFGNSVELRLQ
jgi:hypothetical protein